MPFWKLGIDPLIMMPSPPLVMPQKKSLRRLRLRLRASEGEGEGFCITNESLARANFYSAASATLGGGTMAVLPASTHSVCRSSN